MRPAPDCPCPLCESARQRRFDVPFPLAQQQPFTPRPPSTFPVRCSACQRALGGLLRVTGEARVEVYCQGCVTEGRV